MKFTSPWQSRSFVKSVAILRRVLRPFGNLEEKYIGRLADTHNRRVHKYLGESRPESILLIMPRCVKLTGCRADVQSSLSQCSQCDRCPLGDVARLCDRFHIRALVAFRSHIAFELARELKPDLIIATACSDRLVKALHSVPEHPALLAPLPNMEKKCVNAGVDVGWLEGQLVGLIHGNSTAQQLASVKSSLPANKCKASATRIAEGS